jgi:Mn2+/Fe2+ NRAMP family transporter
MLLFDLRAITTILAVLVALMSILFVTSALMAGLDWTAFFSGMVIPGIPDGSIVTAIALMGTTVVTYNLFLHASASKTYWAKETQPFAWKRELLGMAIFIPLGGVVSLAILATGASVSPDPVPGNIAEFAVLLEPAAGSASRYLFAAGLFAAGLTSAVTAPLAAAAGITELFGWSPESQPWRFRGIWASVVLTGLVFGTGRQRSPASPHRCGRSLCGS